MKINIYYTKDPPRLRMGTTLILNLNILQNGYIQKYVHLRDHIIKIHISSHPNPLRSFNDLSMYMDRQREAIFFYTV